MTRKPGQSKLNYFMTNNLWQILAVASVIIAVVLILKYIF